MILADTAIWIDHLRSGEGPLAQLLESGLTCGHAFVTGELACGNLHDRATVLALLENLPPLSTASEREVLYFIERGQLMGRRIGYIDAHLLAATALHAARLLTRGKRLLALARELGLAWAPDTH